MDYTFKNEKVRFIPNDEVLKKGYFIRHLYETGEEGGFNTTFKPDGWRGLYWHKIENELPGWIGQTMNDFYIRVNGCLNTNMYEVIELLERPK